MNEIEGLKEEVIEMLSTIENWHLTPPSTCQLCHCGFENNNVFKIYLDINGELYCMIFHYECAFNEEYVEEYKNREIEGVM